jgi:hypothetical protein
LVFGNLSVKLAVEKLMKLHFYKQATLLVAILLTFSTFNIAQKKTAVSPIQEQNVRAGMNFLASDAMQGRGSGTQFEWITAQYLGSMMQQFGIEPGGEKDASGNATFIQTVTISRDSFAENPKLNYSSGSLEHGKEMIIVRMTAAQTGGKLQKINADEKPQTGAVVLIKAKDGEDFRALFQRMQKLSDAGANAVLVEESTQIQPQMMNFASRKPSFTTVSGQTRSATNWVILKKDAAAAISQLADGTDIEIKGTLAEPQKQRTWNAVGKITGSDPKLSSEVILLSAHLDHLGMRPNAPGDDKIFNGADDDASGCVAVLELARVLASSAKPKRTVMFAFFGSEEAGGFGSQYLVNTLPFPKEKLVANLQFEMIGRPDPKVKAEELWLTGYERSNLGAELAKRGAKLVQDPHPDQNFFQRSDNYTLARQGIVAHTVSSFGLHKDYHQASDEIKTIDFKHMTKAINSMVVPVRWLVNSNFKPAWYEGKKP